MGAEESRRLVSGDIGFVIFVTHGFSFVPKIADGVHPRGGDMPCLTFFFFTRERSVFAAVSC